MSFTSPREAREASIREFTRLYEPTCNCSPSTIELRAEGSILECAKHATMIRVRRGAR
jgi:hypothetical protein